MAETGAFTIDADWLEKRLGTPGLSIVDASWYLPAQKRDAKAEYEAGHIPGAIFFDQDEVVDPDSELPHTLPDPATFAQARFRSVSMHPAGRVTSPIRLPARPRSTPSA